ncbi:MAG: exonuclease SbcCD subunit D [Candidatus Hydrothermarchaeota archaeon]
MRIAVISDMHLGFGYGTERWDDSFIQAEEAILSAISFNPDIILIAGDIFNSKNPSQEVFSRAFKIFAHALQSSSTIKLLSCNSEFSPLALKGIPVVAIHGTHERKVVGETNPVKTMAAAGYMIHLHRSSIVFKNEEKIAIHGLSGVPERYALNALKKWDPKPFEDAINILMLHQSIHPFIYSARDPPTIRMEDLPSHFDLIINGHIHWNVEDRHPCGTPFLIPGSTERTQLRKKELKPKGFYIIDFPYRSKFIRLKTPRQFYFKSFFFENASQEEIVDKVKEYLASINFKGKKPLVKIKLRGYANSKPDLNALENDFPNLILSKDVELRTPGESKIDFLRGLRSKRFSIEDLGIEILKSELKKRDFSLKIETEEIYELLLKGDEKSIEKILHLEKEE